MDESLSLQRLHAHAHESAEPEALAHANANEATPVNSECGLPLLGTVPASPASGQTARSDYAASQSDIASADAAAGQEGRHTEEEAADIGNIWLPYSADDASPARHEDASALPGGVLIDVVDFSRDWAGASGLTSSDFQREPRDRLLRFGAGQPGTSMMSDPDIQRASSSCSQGNCSHTRERVPLVATRGLISDGCRFVIFAGLHMTDFVLRIWVLYYLARTDIFYVFLIFPLQILGTFMYAYIAFHDNDVLTVLQAVAQRSRIMRPVCTGLVCIVFGCFQLIQVKRAWSRQVYAAEVMTDMDAQKDDTRAVTPQYVQRFSGSERVLPVALFTGVPYCIIMCYALQTEPWVHWQVDVDLIKYVLISSTLLTLIIVSFGIVEIDNAVSAYVLKRYHYNPNLKETCWGRVQWVYPAVHIMFRACEVFMRTLVITSFFLTTHNRLGQVALGFLFVADYAFVVLVLRHYAPTEERLLVHVFVGIAYLVADLSHFVDQPNFAEPARYISRSLTLWRLALLFMVLAAGYWAGSPDQGGGASSTEAGWEFKMYALICTAFLCYSLRYSPVIRKVGQDLHTAALEGNEERVQKLLKATTGGQVLDVNGFTKDAKGMTPAMFAAKAGHKEVLELLVDAGAELNERSLSGDTCLHYAARNLNMDTCRYLLKQGADPHIPNLSGELPKDLVSDQAWPCGRRDDSPETFMLKSLLSEEGTSSRHSSRSRAYGRRKNFYTVNAEVCGGLTLGRLFPDAVAADSDTGSPRTLHSVSGLVASRAAGLLARRVLARSPGGALSLGALRRVRDLGQGGFGKVIEVEIPYDAAAAVLWRRHGARKFALKLQPKHQAQRTAASEVLALRRAHHPFIVRLERAFQTPKFFALLLELCPTDLNRVLCQEDEFGRCIGLPVSQAAKYMGQVLLALVHLHSIEGIVYRDVKPENILISAHDDAKLTDFGLAEDATVVQKMTRAGTMGFLAPELADSTGDVWPTPVNSHLSSRLSTDSDSVLRNAFKTDAYAFGVTLQLALLGESAGQRREVRRKGSVMMPLLTSEAENVATLEQLKQAEKLSADAYNLLVEHLLPNTPSERHCLSDEQVMNHPFFLNALKCDDLKDELIPECAVAALASASARSSFLVPRARSSRGTPEQSLLAKQDDAA